METLKDIGTILGVITSAVAVLELVFSPFRRYLKWRKYLRDTFAAVWKPPQRLKPETVMGSRGTPKFGYRAYYYSRDADRAIRERIAKGQHVLILGDPLAGKTRAAYEALKAAKRLAVTIPCLDDIKREAFRVPPRRAFWRRKVLLLDDLDKFMGKQNFVHLLNKFLGKGAVVVATCRSGDEYARLRAALERERLDGLFGDPVQIPAITTEEAACVARQAGVKMPRHFDHRIGSIFLDIEGMRVRFRELSDEERAILRSVKRLYYAGAYRGREVFPLDWVRRVGRGVEQVEMPEFRWNERLRHLAEQAFLDIQGEEARAEEAHLQFVVEGAVQGNGDILPNLQRMREALAADPEALALIGNRAWEQGQTRLEKADFMRAAVDAYKEAARLYAERGAREDYAMTQNNLGVAYSTLAEVEDKGENCRRAIQAYHEALKVYTLDRFPIQYAMTQYNLGNAYSTLAEVEDKGENCRRAIHAYHEALNIFRADQFPEVYSIVARNLEWCLRFCQGQ